MFKPEVFTSVRCQLWKYPSCNMTGAVKWWQKLLTFPKHMRSCCAIFSFLFNILLIIVCPFLLPFALHVLWLTASIGPFDIFKFSSEDFTFYVDRILSIHKFYQCYNNKRVGPCTVLQTNCISKDDTCINIIQVCIIFIQNDYWKFRPMRGHALLWIGAFHTHFRVWIM